MALVSVFLIPVVVTAAVAFHMLRGEPVQEAIDLAAQRLQADAAQWNDPEWQATTRDELAAEGTDFVLVNNGRELYRSSADLFAAPDGGERRVRRIEVPGADSGRVAYVYARLQFGPPEMNQTWIVPIVAVTTLLLTLSGIGLFLGRTVVAPLAATNRAARQVAAGNLDIELPSSRVREVAEVNAAFHAMSAELRASLHQQATLEQERRLFIGAVAHDLRTPLFSLRGYLEGLEKGLADTPEKTARYITIAQEKAAALERLIADLFDYTRLEYLDQAPQRERLDFGALLRRLIDGMRPQAETKGVVLAFEGTSAECLVEGDSHLLTRAVENLIDNALRFTPSGGRVQVECHAAPDRVEFSVSDSGPGIPTTDLPNLFTPLYRGETSRNRRTGGAGLGLTVARRILRAHGGELTAKNGATGGAVFIGILADSSPSRPAPSAELTVERWPRERMDSEDAPSRRLRRESPFARRNA